MIRIDRRDLLKSAILGAGAGATAACGRADAPTAPATFTHGVASGDPLADRVILWTRAVPGGGADDGEIAWEVAKDADFRRTVSRGRAVTSRAGDFTVKADAGGLEPGTSYYYRFTAGENVSPTGRTRTLPAADAQSVRLAVVSCSNHPAGYFNVYRAIADRDDLDAVLHLGDYIYEYGPDGYATAFGAGVGRVPEPPHEILTLSDYRTRYAQYRSDPDLQAVHAAHPFIQIWDDHESANDSYVTGADNHDEGEGPWNARRLAAMRAYFEWTPIRTGGAFDEPLTLNRDFEFGGIAHLIMLETRLKARARPFDYARDLPFVEGAFDVSDPDRPVFVPSDRVASVAQDTLVTRPILFDVSGAAPRPITEPERLAALDPANLPAGVAMIPDAARFRAMLADETRELLGAEQRRRIAAALARANERGAAWRVFGNQVIMARVTSPNLGPLLDQEQIDDIATRFPAIRGYVPLSRFGLPFNLDSWDGYDAARERLFDDLKAAPGANLVLTGDTHSFWANEVTDRTGARVAAEFGTSSVTSPSVGAYLNTQGFDIGEAVAAANDPIRLYDVNNHGYLAVTLTKERAVTDMVGVSTITARDFETRILRRYAVDADEGAPVREIAVEG